MGVCLAVYCVKIGEARVLMSHEDDVAGGGRSPGKGKK